MRLGDVDFPQPIIDARKRGKLVIFAGAGVSIDAPSNYPNFVDLATEIGGPDFPRNDQELIDRYLGRLEQQGRAVHERVKGLLSDPNSRPNHLHQTLVRLFGTSDAVRIVTTNFDDHFHGAATDVFGRSPRIFAAPALPLGDDFNGIVYLHGSVRDDAKKLVLTDADFGRAYLTQGWARRFVQRLFAEFVVLFVGYSHQDLPLLYLARGLSAAADGPGRYALTSPTSDTDWLNLGIIPVPYPLRADPLPRHGALGDCLARWAELANLGSLGTEAEIRRIVTSDRPESPEESDFLKHALCDISTVRFFTRHARDLRWLHWISDTPDFNAIFIPESTLSDISREFALWFAEHFAISQFSVALELVRRKGQTLSGVLWQFITGGFHRHRTAGDPLRFWVPILLQTTPANMHSDLLAYIIDHCTIPDDQQTVLQLFRGLTSPSLRLRKRFFPPEDGTPVVPDGEVVPIGSDHSVTRAYQVHIRPHLGSLANGLALIVTSAFEEARTLLLMYNKAGDKWDPISFARGSTASRTQDHLRNGFSVLIDAGVDVLNWANANKPNFAAALIAQWIESDAPILRRLAITGMVHHSLLTSEEKLSWAISNRLIEDVWLKNEMFALLAEVYGACSEDVRDEFLVQAEGAYSQEGEDHERYELFNIFSWLHSHDPECGLVSQKLEQIQRRHPEWRVREHPDFNSWIGGGVRQLVPESPVPTSQIEEMDLEALSAELARLATVTDPFGDSSKDGFLQEIARTAAANFLWSEGIASSALESALPPAEIWSALLRGWTSIHSLEQWTKVLRTIVRLEPIYGSVLHEIASLLKGAVDDRNGDLPRVLLGDALEIANSLWMAVVEHEKPLPDTSSDWVTVAINRTAGYVMDFYFDALRTVWRTRAQEQEMIQSIVDALVVTIGGDAPASEVARILVPSRALLLAGIAPEWYEGRVLPLLSAPVSPRSSEQSWDGYLAWGSWSQETLPGLLPVYLNHLPEIIKGTDERSRMYCGHLAGIAVFGAIDPIDNGWLDTFLTRASRRERLNWVGDVARGLREADQQARESAWDRWLQRYLQRRSQANPIPLEDEEAGAMCEWALILKSHYADIVELLLAGPTPQVKKNMFYYRLHEENILEVAPALTARLLTALLSREDGHDIWDWEQIHEMVAHLIDLNPAEAALRPLCEELGRLGSDRALEFRDRLR
jgi:hypothetical protein